MVFVATEEYRKRMSETLRRSPKIIRWKRVCNQSELMGWIKALEWVLNDKEEK
jgi:hypothetical protein